MSFPLLMLFQQLRATQPVYFVLVTFFLLVAGGVGWLIAAVLGFARSPAFGRSARWFSYAAVCMIIYHLHFLLFGVFVYLGAEQNAGDLATPLSIGAFFNLFVVFGAICAIIGFVKMTSTRYRTPMDLQMAETFDDEEGVVDQEAAAQNAEATAAAENGQARN